MVVPMEQWAGQPFQDKSADLWVVMLSDHNEKYSDRMERSYKAFAVTFELRFPFPLRFTVSERGHILNQQPRGEDNIVPLSSLSRVICTTNNDLQRGYLIRSGRFIMSSLISTLGSEQHGRNFADDILNKNFEWKIWYFDSLINLKIMTTFEAQCSIILS